MPIKQRIRRTGADVLVFWGELLAKADNRRSPEFEHKIWHEIAVYQVEAAQNFELEGEPPHYLLKVTLASCEPKQPAHEWAALAAGEDVAAALATYHPLSYLRGYPPLDRLADLNASWRAKITASWQQLCGEVLVRAAEKTDPVSG